MLSLCTGTQRVLLTPRPSTQGAQGYPQEQDGSGFRVPGKLCWPTSAWAELGESGSSLLPSSEQSKPSTRGEEVWREGTPAPDAQQGSPGAFPGLPEGWIQGTGEAVG